MNIERTKHEAVILNSNIVITVYYFINKSFSHQREFNRRSIAQFKVRFREQDTFNTKSH